MTKFDYHKVEKLIHYTFNNKQLLLGAFVHSSYGYEHNMSDNERLEYLGDALLGAIVAEYLYDKYPNMDAGELSKARASIVSSKGLKRVVKQMDIMQYLLMSGNIAKNLGKTKKMEANLFEALLCAVYFDSNMERLREYALFWLQPYLDTVNSNITVDYKSRLQELCQRERYELFYKQIDKTGSDNNPTFYYVVVINGEDMGQGCGKTIKQAQAGAAMIAFQKLVNKD